MATLETQESVGALSTTPDRYSSAGSAVAQTSRWLGIGAMTLFVILALSPNGATRISLWPWSLLTCMMALTPIILLLASPWDGRATSNFQTTITLGLLGAVLVLSAFGSSYVAQSLEACLIPLGSIATVFLIGPILNSDQTNLRISPVCLQKFIGAFGIAFTVVSLVGWTAGTLLPQWANHSALGGQAGLATYAFHPFQFRNEFPLGHANYTAGLTLILLPWQAGLALQSEGNRRRFWLAASLATAFVLYTAGSRGALLGIGTIAASTLLILGLRRRIRGTQLLAGISVIIVSIGILAFATPRIRSLVTDLAASGSLNSGDVQRWSMAEAGLRMGLDSPLLGQGPGVTPLTYPDYRNALDGGVESALQLHSTPIQVWADLGLAGSILCLLSVGFTLNRGFRILAGGVSDGRSSTTIVLGSAVVSTVGYLAFSLTDFQFDIPVFTGLFATNIGVILAARIKREGGAQAVTSPRLGTLSRTIKLAGVILMAPVLWATAQSQLARGVFASAVTKLEHHDVQAFLHGASAAGEWNPGNGFYPTSTGASLLRMSFLEPDPGRKASLENLATEAFRKSLQISDNQEIAHFNLGWLLLETDPISAENHFVRASQLVPDKGGVYLGLGLARFEQGEHDGAIEAIALEMVNDPAFITAPFWDIPAFSDLRNESAARAAWVLLQIAAFPETTARLGEQCVHAANLIRGFDHEVPEVAMNPEGRKLTEGLPADAERRSEAIQAYLKNRYGQPADADRVAAYTDLLDPAVFEPESFAWHPAGCEWPLVRTQRRERPGYGILMRNLDGPTPIDAYLVQTNGIILDFYSTLFPPKGHLPTTAMVRAAQLTEESRS